MFLTELSTWQRHTKLENNTGHLLRTSRDVIGRWAWPTDGGKSPVNALQISENTLPVWNRLRHHVFDVQRRLDVCSAPVTFHQHSAVLYHHQLCGYVAYYKKCTCIDQYRVTGRKPKPKYWV